MATHPASENRSYTSISQKLRNVCGLKSKSNDKVEREFEIIHTPDRPTRLILPIEAPTEDRCGEEIAKWQRASARNGINTLYEKMSMVG